MIIKETKLWNGWKPAPAHAGVDAVTGIVKKT